MELNLTLFVKCYLVTAAWMTCDSGENDTFTKDAKIIAENDCIAFINAVRAEFGDTVAKELLETKGNDLSYLVPHDFYLTRNGNSAGFWDKPEMYGGQENADRLTKIAENFGGVDCYHVKGKKSKLTF